MMHDLCLYNPGKGWLRNYFARIKKSSTFKSVFIGYGLKTGQGVYPGPIYLMATLLFSQKKISGKIKQSLQRHSLALQNGLVLLATPTLIAQMLFHCHEK